MHAICYAGLNIGVAWRRECGPESAPALYHRVLSTVQKYFPQVAHELYSGRNTTATGLPTATRSVIFVNGDASKKGDDNCGLVRDGARRFGRI